MTKVIILNSGTGSRMGNLTADKPKCLVELTDSDTIITRQLRLLRELGVNDVVITTGPYEKKIIDHLEGMFDAINISYVNNPLYQETNYIYSLLLVEGMINEDVLLMHGDLVFERVVLKRLNESNYQNAVLVNPYVKLPEKDFKAEMKNGRIKKIAVNIFSPQCVFLLPMYKLELRTFKAWLKEVKKFEKRRQLTVYAENALNNLLDELALHPVELKGEFCMEIDDAKDLKKARRYLAQAGGNK